MQNKNSKISWEEFTLQSDEFRSTFYQRENHFYHCISSSQFDRQFLDYIYKLTNKVRLLNKTATGANFLRKPSF